MLLTGTILRSLDIPAQLIDHTSTFRNINQKSYFRFHYDNDFFTKTDYYYTQGITLEYVHPSLKKFRVAKILLKTTKSDPQYGISFNLFGYTPTSIKTNDIRYGDRPFEGSISLKMFAVSTSSSNKLRLSSAISTGIIGPAALGKEIQTNIHRWTGNIIPKGWQHQVSNDFILNYQLTIEKNLLAAAGFHLNGAAEFRAGTLHNRLGAGINFMTGHFNDPYQKTQKKKTTYYLYGQGRVHLIGYDATLQGGLFNRKSPYVIAPGDITRITFQADAGLVVNLKNLFINYTQSFLTREFRKGKDHRWGGISIGFAL